MADRTQEEMAAMYLAAKQQEQYQQQSRVNLGAQPAQQPQQGHVSQVCELMWLRAAAQKPLHR